MKNVLIKCVLWVGLVVAAAAQAQGLVGPPEKVLRYAFRSAETGFDPAQVSDLYSRTVTANIFESLYRYDYLARPVKVVPKVAADMPTVSADFKTFTIQLKKGIYFADDPAFQGKRRELTAADFVYSVKRIFDPKTKSSQLPEWEDAKVLGLAELRADAEKAGGKFNYDKEIEGLRALDRYVLQIRLGVSTPRFIYLLSDSSIQGAVAREVVEYYGDKIMEHPVGTGPFKLDQWVRTFSIT